MPSLIYLILLLLIILQVLYDFDLFFPGKSKFFKKTWSQITESIRLVFIAEKKTEMFKIKDWSEDIKSFIKLLQLLPAPPAGRKKNLFLKRSMISVKLLTSS